MVSGRNISTAEAIDCGLVDEVVTEAAASPLKSRWSDCATTLPNKARGATGRHQALAARTRPSPILSPSSSSRPCNKRWHNSRQRP